MKTPVIMPAVMAGGSGTRLWPLSRQSFPKQFVALGGDRSLFQQALARVQGPEFSDPMILGHVDHRFLLAEHARSAGIHARAIVLEPSLRDTAPAACVAALYAQDHDPEALVLLMPCDHLISEPDKFRKAIVRGAEAASAGAVVVFGVTPTSPHDGYGYIECTRPLEPQDADPIPVARFVEKPSRQVAEGYLKSGCHLWNSGIFLFRASALVKAFESMTPEILAACRESLQESTRDLDFIRLAPAAYMQAPKISLDYAIIEKTKGMRCVPLPVSWSDCGTWASVQETLERDEQGNVAKGDVLIQSSTDCLTYNVSGSTVVTLGLESVLTVVTDDSVLVASKAHSNELKSIVERMAQEGKEQAHTHRRVYRPWGWYEGLGKGNRYQVKCIMLKPGAKLSLQSHMHRAEHWIVVSGMIEVTCGENIFTLNENESTYIPVHARHRMANPGRIPAFLIEVQSGAYLGEDDIQRFDDVYGRV